MLIELTKKKKKHLVVTYGLLPEIEPQRASVWKGVFVLWKGINIVKAKNSAYLNVSLETCIIPD